MSFMIDIFLDFITKKLAEGTLLINPYSYLRN